MESSSFKLCRISRNDQVQLFPNIDYGLDTENCVIVSNVNFVCESWLNITTVGNKNKRKLPCIATENVTKCDEILAKEDVYYNICRVLNLSVAENVHNVICEVDTCHSPKLVESVDIATIRSTVELSGEDEKMLLYSYFATPRHVFLNDIIGVPLSEVPYLSKSAAYHNISAVHYKVTNVLYKGEKWTSGSEGLYVVQNESQLYCQPALTSELPPISTRTYFSNQPTTSPNLQPYVNQMRELIMPFNVPERPKCPPVFLMLGPDGSGQVEVIRQSAGFIGFHFLLFHCQDVFGISVSAVETKLDFLFEKCFKMGPCILALDDVQLIGKDKSGVEDPRLVSIFLDKLQNCVSQTSSHPLIVVGIADTKDEDLLPSLSRAFLHSIKFQPSKPDIATLTFQWLVAAEGLTIDDDGKGFLEKKLLGFVHEDLVLLVDHCMRWHYVNENGKISNVITRQNLENAIETMESAYSNTIGAAKVAQVRWEDVGGMGALKDEIMLTLRLPKNGENRLRRSGILFYGPPGTGKTLMAKAVATECSMNFLAVKGPELMNMYVGQSERNVREVFERGRDAAPCVLFFDELDSLAPPRGKSGDGGGVTDRVVSQLLAEMDGLHSNRGLFVIAATNRPDLVDPALLRPGRFDKSFYLGPCADSASKLSVFKAQTNKFVFSDKNIMDAVVELLPPLVTGADIYSVCSNAWLYSARRSILLSQQGDKVHLPLEVTLEDFKKGVENMVPSLSADDLKYYEKLSRDSKS